MGIRRVNGIRSQTGMVAISAAIAAVGLGACGSSKPAAISTTTVASVLYTPPPNVTTTTDVPAGTTFTPGASSPVNIGPETCLPGSSTVSGPIPVSAISSSSQGDFDGDGSADKLTAYVLPGETDKIHIREDLANGYSTEAVIGATAAVPIQGYPQTPFADGAFDASGTKRDLGFVTIYAGASTTFVGMFDLVQCKVTPITDKTGQIITLGSGGSVLHQAQFGCNPKAHDGPAIYTWQVDFDAGGAGGASTSYQEKQSELVFSGDTLIQETSTSTPGKGAPGSVSPTTPLPLCGSVTVQ